MSLEPVAAALIGLALLGQHLSVSEWAAVGCVVIACIGAARSALPSPAPPPISAPEPPAGPVASPGPRRPRIAAR